ncbi:SRPBCC family protein [Arachidicoccus terrestris]|uniref:SRPBCC family protein n=1 Tax=Arachidicoccus terrestris TaxID=2875539 RepID=UPI001CC352E4|nr:SRPBCC domain-containing protein [Arachidicoccus terrestris]UAY55365.1 SRPBCC domain-containing protein [Arachidicoccus terrestris]
MSNHLLFDFVVNKEEKTIHIKREFNANLELVWQAWTTAELLDQWWGPKPWKAQTKTMDFREGGFWLYAMVGPQGEKHWSRSDYISIEHGKSITHKDSFCDENGTSSPSAPQNVWRNDFSEKENKVHVDILLSFDALSDLETLISMGFKEGMTTDFNQLDALLLTMNK